MRYYIDFEASNYWQEIISIGCVDEKGRKFYSLVRPRKIDKVTKFITDLTGITKEELKKAKPLNEVAREFNNWVKDYNKSEFICYGDGDLHFLKGEMSRPWNKAVQADRFLHGVYNSLSDGSQTIKRYYKLDEPIKLISVYNHLAPGEYHEQIHDALDDAEMLKFVYEHYQGDAIDPCPFPSHILSDEQKGKKVTVIDVQNDETFIFPSLSSAVRWFINNDYCPCRLKTDVKNALKDCSDNQTLCWGFKIIIETKSEEE